MRKLLRLLTVAFLFQSCYTYKTLDLDKDKLTAKKVYRIRLEEETIKADLIAENDSSLTVLRFNKNKEIRKSDIREIESRKFSVAKTVGYPVGIATLVAGLFAWGLSE